MPYAKVYGPAETLRCPVYQRHTKVREGIVGRQLTLEAPITECTVPLEVHAETVVLVSGDAQSPSSKRPTVKALVDRF